MSCRRICRELLWLTRFGEVGPDSAPHLDHLTTCRACRDEVGFDRAMVERLREALLARVADASPSPTAWENIVARAQAPEPPRIRLWEWSTALVARLRVATGMAFAGLALVLALNTQLVPAGLPTASSSDAVGDSALLSELRFPQRGQGPAADRPAAAGRQTGVVAGPAQRWEPFVPPGLGGAPDVAPDAAEPAEEAPAETFVLVFSLIEQPDPVAPAEDEPAPAPEPIPSTISREPGEPS